MHSFANHDYPWVCPRCKVSLVLGKDCLSCRLCQTEYPIRYGIPDFRLGWQETPTQMRLADRLYNEWDQLTYRDMFKARFDGLRQRALEMGREVNNMLNWDEKAQLSSITSRGNAHCRVLRGMVQGLGAEPRAKILLDIGCGYGRDLLALSQLSEQTIAVDVSTYSLLIAAKLMEEHGVTNMRFILARGEQLPLPDAAVDAVNSSATIEHFPDADTFLSEVSRCMAPGGWVFLYYPNRFCIGPELHTGIWFLGWHSMNKQMHIVQNKLGRKWDVTRMPLS